KMGQRYHPQDYWINYNLGRCLVRLKPPQLEEAIRYFTVAVALRPEVAQSRSNLANALTAQGRLDEAAAVRPALTRGPTLAKPAAGATLDNGSQVSSKLQVWQFDWSD